MDLNTETIIVSLDYTLQVLHMIEVVYELPVAIFHRELRIEL
jgi:hypothetical protein